MQPGQPQLPLGLQIGTAPCAQCEDIFSGSDIFTMDTVPDDASENAKLIGEFLERELGIKQVALRPLLGCLGKLHSSKVDRLHQVRKDSFLGSLSASSRSKAPSLYERRFMQPPSIPRLSELSD